MDVKSILVLISLMLCYLPVVLLKEGVCQKTLRVTKFVRESYRRTYVESYKEKCYGVWKCSKTRISFYIDWRNVRKVDYKTEDVCCNNYMMDDDMSSFELVCKPVCYPPCNNALCTKPGVCTCLEGYLQSAPYTCLPQCSSGCPNGKCVEPDKCECNFGYREINNTCTPICHDPCINATCVAPDTCKCLNGFRNYPNSSISCAPYCSSGCSNGVCREPETCSCNDGYELNDIFCKPVCEYGCGNGTCIRPNICICDEGFKQNENGTCVPHCDICLNGECISPGVCECLIGYEEIDNKCEPVCEPPCKNGICTKPDFCQCYPGYTSRYNICEPLCGICLNGYCYAPNECKCNDGYIPVNNKSDNCTANCEPSCDVNEYCSAPNNCTCLTGYKLEDDKCRPQCNSCRGEVCITPNTCECKEGYKLKKDSVDDNECVAECEQDCSNGSCTAPNECTCDLGYENANGTCIPKCSDCTNGLCVSPGVCKCNDGYKLGDDFNCQPVCSLCNDGICVAPNICANDHLLYTASPFEEEMTTDDDKYNTSTINSSDVEILYTTETVNEGLINASKNRHGNEDDTENTGISYEYWLYGGIILAAICVITIVVFKQRSIVKYFRGESYSIEGQDNEISVVFSPPDLLNVTRLLMNKKFSH